MAENSNISWTRSTWNPWIGCSKVSPGCDGCYAEALDKRVRFGGAVHWGAGVPRYRTSAANWAKPLAWNKAAPGSEFAGRRGFWPVFCASLADVFDNEVPEDWRRDLFSLIELTPNLSWLLVTKRISNVRKMTPMWCTFPDNVRILITVVNQEEADRDIPKLLALPCKNGVSYEPALSGVDWSRYLCPWNHAENRYGKRLEWLICGGESSQPGHPARPFNMEWARSTVRQCKAARVPVFMKQAGSFVIDRNDAGFVGDGDDLWPAGTADKLKWEPFGYVENAQGSPVQIKLKDRAGADPAEWPRDLQIQEFPL